ncbi:hypothetical protein MMC14_002814 [Varicellaria rhodocarpa]|nr:hypothetical protein [Varicellaria rhodocarpa]
MVRIIFAFELVGFSLRTKDAGLENSAYTSPPPPPSRSILRNRGIGAGLRFCSLKGVSVTALHYIHIAFFSSRSFRLLNTQISGRDGDKMEHLHVFHVDKGMLRSFEALDVHPCLKKGPTYSHGTESGLSPSTDRISSLCAFGAMDHSSSRTWCDTRKTNNQTKGCDLAVITSLNVLHQKTGRSLHRVAASMHGDSTW